VGPMRRHKSDSLHTVKSELPILAQAVGTQ
jgi:hypothetical protein